MKFLTFLLLISLLTGLLSGCGNTDPNSRKASENYATEMRPAAGFKGIKAGSAVILIISVQEEFAVTVEGEESLIKNVKTEVKGETLEISTGDKVLTAKKIRLKISMPELTGLELWGASEATVKNVKSNALKIQTGSTSSVQIDGETKSLTANANGTSRIDAENLKTENAEARAAGTSEITVSVTGELFAEAYGASTVFYTNEPKNLKQNIAGAGEIRKK